MTDDLKKAVLCTLIGAMFAGAWSFDSYLDYKTAHTQEQTKRVISMDKRCVAMATLGMTCNDWKGGRDAK